MVMVANKKNAAQMADDLSLFLGPNTAQFTTWYGQHNERILWSSKPGNSSLFTVFLFNSRLQGVLEKLRTVAVGKLQSFIHSEIRFLADEMLTFYSLIF